MAKKVEPLTALITERVELLISKKLELSSKEDNKVNLLFLFHLKLAGPKKVVDWCMEIGLISKSYECSKCNMPMKLVETKKASDGVSWRCRKGGTDNPHEIHRSVRRGTWFDNCRMSLINVLMFSYMWLGKVPTAFIVNEFAMSVTTISEWKSFCREVCVEACVKESVSIGGLDVLVEIDGCESSNKNYSNDPNKPNGNWVFFGVENHSKKFFFQVVDSGCKEELLNIIKKFVLPGSIIACPLFKTYNCLRDRNFVSQRLKYALKYSPNSSGNQINSINGIRGVVQRSIRYVYRGKELYDSFLAVALWKRLHKDDANLFLSYLRAISLVYPPPVKDEVIKIKFQRHKDNSFSEEAPLPTAEHFETQFYENVPEVILEEIAGEVTVTTDNNAVGTDDYQL